MAYGKLKADTLTYDNNGTDVDITISTMPDAAAVALKADLASPALTGTPTAPTAAQGTNTTQLATTAYVQAELTAGNYLDNADVGVTVQAYDANLPAGNTILVDGDVGVTVQAYDANLPAGNTILVDGDVGVSVQAYDADTTKNDVANTFTAEQTFNSGLSVDGPYKQAVEAVSALDIDLSTGNYFTKTVTATPTVFTFSNPPASGTVGAFTLEVTHTSGTIQWPNTVKWNGDTEPSLTAGNTHLFMFITDNGGSRYRGAALVDYVN